MGLSLIDMQDQLLAKLQEIFPEPTYQVEDFPDDPEKYQFAHSNAAILLVFNDRKFDPPQATDGSTQYNEPEFQIAFMCRQLRSTEDRDGAYNLLETARNGLKGMEIGNHNLSISREYFRSLKPGGVWIFGQNWKTGDIFD